MKSTINDLKPIPINKKQVSLIWIGFLFSLFYWIMESVRDVVGLEKGTFIERMFHPDLISCWMRLLVVSLLVGFGAIAHSFKTRVESVPVKPSRRFHVGGMIWAGLAFSVLYWLLESFRDMWIFGKGSLADCLVAPNHIDIWMRVMAVCVILLFSIYAQILINDRRNAEQILKETQERLERLVNERTRAVSESNRLLKQEIDERIRTEKELLKANRALKIHSECNEVLARSSDECSFLNDVSKKLVDIGGYSMVWVDLIQHNGKCKLDSISQAASNQEDLEVLIWFHTKTKIEELPVHKAIETLSPVVIHDFSLLTLDDKNIHQLRERGFCSLICIPLINNDKIIGVFSILDTKENIFDDQEVGLLIELANDLAFGITALKTRKKHQSAEREKEQIRIQLLQAQKMEAVGILAGGVAHDFNNLLTAIQVSVDLAKMGVDENSITYKELNEIHLVANHASELARQLLLFSRKHPMQPDALDLNDVVNHLYKMLIRLIGEKINIKSELDSQLWHVWADRSTIEQVIVNLAVNARDAMKNGGDLIIRTENTRLNKTKCKQIPESRPGKYVKLTVEDTGIGMSKDILNRIFEPFFSTKSPGKATGLGLSVVYGIIKEHEGFIRVDSQIGVGTLFEIFLPALYMKPELKEEKRIPFERLQGRGKRILIIEDEDKVREFTCKGLQMNGYEVFTACNGYEAEIMFDHELSNIDVIFSDVVLPDTSGVALSERLRKKKSDLKVLLCSGYADEQVRSSEFQGNGFTFLHKPYTLGDVLQKLQVLLKA